VLPLFAVALLVLFVLMELVLPPPTNPVPKSVDQMLG
jgi:hypothetical protein